MCFMVAKMPKAQWDRDMDTIMEILVAHGQPLLLYNENQNKETAFWFSLLIGAFTRYKYSSTSGFQIII